MQCTEFSALLFYCLRTRCSASNSLFFFCICQRARCSASNSCLPKNTASNSRCFFSICQRTRCSASSSLAFHKELDALHRDNIVRTQCTTSSSLTILWELYAIEFYVKSRSWSCFWRCLIQINKLHIELHALHRVIRTILLRTRYRASSSLGFYERIRCTASSSLTIYTTNSMHYVEFSFNTIRTRCS